MTSLDLQKWNKPQPRSLGTPTLAGAGESDGGDGAAKTIIPRLRFCSPGFHNAPKCFKLFGGLIGFLYGLEEEMGGGPAARDGGWRPAGSGSVAESQRSAQHKSGANPTLLDAPSQLQPRIPFSTSSSSSSSPAVREMVVALRNPEARNMNKATPLDTACRNTFTLLLFGLSLFLASFVSATDTKKRIENAPIHSELFPLDASMNNDPQAVSHLLVVPNLLQALQIISQFQLSILLKAYLSNSTSQGKNPNRRIL